MMKLIRLEVDGFGPFADRQVLDFPEQPGVTVIYGENMRGKTTLLNAIRYAFFGVAVGRGSRERRVSTLTNRDLAAEGKFGFSVCLTFEHDGERFELERACRPIVSRPTADRDYIHDVLVRRGASVLGPDQAKTVLQRAFPVDVSRFFLFDGELLQEYEELLINESDAGRRISEAIERILGVPILKRGRAHLAALADSADETAAKEASRHKNTQLIGGYLEAATVQKAAHQADLARLEERLRTWNREKADIEREMESSQRYAALLVERDAASARLVELERDEKDSRAAVQRLMADAWRTLVGPRVKAARDRAQLAVKREIEHLTHAIRARSFASGLCEVCQQPISEHMRTTVAQDAAPSDSVEAGGSAFARMADLQRLEDTDVSGELAVHSMRLRAIQLERASLIDRISDLNGAFGDADANAVRQSRASYKEVLDKIGVDEQASKTVAAKIKATDDNIANLKKKLALAGGVDLEASQKRSATLHAAARVFAGAVERYKADLRRRVEQSATNLFLAMTTEKSDYAGLTINEGYGLTIRHRDGAAEEARSAGAEHVVALALMGALQQNAPLRGPIVMDSPFGRLDEGHTSNVVKALPTMADQVVLFVYEAEVGRDRMREVLGANLRREYQLDKVSARRTNIIEVK